MIPRAVSASLVTFEREIYDYRKNLFLFALRNLIQGLFLPQMNREAAVGAIKFHHARNLSQCQKICR